MVSFQLVSLNQKQLFTYNVDKKEGMGIEMYGVLVFENPYESGPSLDNYLVSMLIKGKI